jgi:hypothetical protein
MYFDNLKVGDVLVCVNRHQKNKIPYECKVTYGGGYDKTEKLVSFEILYFIGNGLNRHNIILPKTAFTKIFILYEDYLTWKRRVKINKIKKLL